MFVDMRHGEVDLKGRPQVVWTANWNRRVGENATLKYNQGGSLCSIDEHNEIWSAYPSGMSNVVGMSIDECGNMMIFNESSQPVWESFQYPTDTLLMGQVITADQQLTSRTISFHARQCLFKLSLNARAIVALSAGDEPTQYLTKGEMGFYYQTEELTEMLAMENYLLLAKQIRRMLDSTEAVRSDRTGPDGKDYFTLKDYQHPHLGCREITPPIALQGLYTEKICKQACNDNTTCKAAFIVSKEIANEGSCYMYSDSQMLSLMGNPHENTNFRSYSWGKTPLAVYSFLITVIVLVAVCFLLWKKINCACVRRKHLKSLISGSLIRFSYSEMSFATAKFSTRLGTGGFGVVYKGVLKDGTLVAVKRLENTGQGGIEEFLAEVNTLGNRHHINLVKLIGFCVEKSHRILVYEYMSKGSLDKWIFHGNSSIYLDWKTRKKIVLNTAKGLAYIHGDCRQRIAHLDVKPQNIS
ncbi:hypothetical protein F3Y22_tig00110988pilonHSYRG00160 [Hibiscus syriacus]|uniref:Uncharacterized protein n=1 Tax=Hibiscus syriacus TaxID=106335 RepID=A0A6A2ZB35_HIBSY|nr:hypothetical protein F3Y22_tig00110988pilonHSYRG00160 [Hibiscus syriacus]